VTVRLLTPDDVPAFVAYENEMSALSGVAEHHHGPYPAGDPLPPDFAQRTASRITAPVGARDWRRYWGAWTDGTLVGVAHISGGGLPSESHRLHLGMGVRPAARRQGHARALLRAVVEWCVEAPGVAWLDLGVFAHNPAAIALYQSEGFVELGRTPDRFRVDGVRIIDITMTLSVE
jgi:GNAT superfamily N-acetyltransferase